jgi:hypothetical protein
MIGLVKASRMIRGRAERTTELWKYPARKRGTRPSDSPVALQLASILQRSLLVIAATRVN